MARVPVVALLLIAAMTEFERDLIRERVSAGLRAAKRRGTRIGRPRASVDLTKALAMRAKGKSYRQIAKALGVGASTIHRALAADEKVHECERPDVVPDVNDGNAEAA